jgi:hypothetical protein
MTGGDESLASVRSKTFIGSWNLYVNGLIAAEISSLSRYYDRLVQWCPLPHDAMVLFESIDSPKKDIATNLDQLALRAADGKQQGQAVQRQVILLNGNLNHEADMQALLTKLRSGLTRRCRVLAVAYNPYLRWLYKLANLIGLRTGEQPFTFLTMTDAYNLAQLCRFEIVRTRTVAYFPFKLLGLGDLINAWLPFVPILGRLGFATILIFRPIIIENAKPSLSIIIPTKNEKGNVENALKRLPDFGGARLEIVFVDGHSTDGTWEEITRLIPLYSQRFSMAAFQQEGDGKAQAVRLGFSRATKDLVVILDADLSTPPELLERFYDAYCSGLGDFINGNRLVYPTAPGSMATLNKLGNVFFAKTLSLILGTAIGDALCGTKFFARDDYHRFSAWRKDFGDHDPFGDFELLFPAAVLALGILDVPVRYQNRTYGTTNIRRFYHGWQLLKMAAVGMFGITLGQTKVLANKISLKTK